MASAGADSIPGAVLAQIDCGDPEFEPALGEFFCLLDRLLGRLGEVSEVSIAEGRHLVDAVVGIHQSDMGEVFFRIVQELGVRLWRDVLHVSGGEGERD